MDELPLPENCKRIEIIVAGYNNNSFQFIDEPPFVCAEVEREGRIELFTDTVYERCGFKVSAFRSASGIRSRETLRRLTTLPGDRRRRARRWCGL